MLPEEKKEFTKYLEEDLKLGLTYVKLIVSWIDKVLGSANIKQITELSELVLCFGIIPMHRGKSRWRRYFHRNAMQNYARFLHETGRLGSENPYKKYLTKAEHHYIVRYADWLNKKGYSQRRIGCLIRVANKYFYKNPLASHPIDRDHILKFQKSFPPGKMNLSKFIRFLESEKILSPCADEIRVDPSLGIPMTMQTSFKDFVESFRGRYNSTWGPRTWGMLLNFGDFLTKERIARLEDVTRKTVSQFLLLFHQQKLTPGYINDISWLLMQFYEWCAEEYGWQIQPVSKNLHYVKQGTHLPRPLSASTVKLLKDQLPQNWFRTAFYLGLEAGFRACDILNLKLEDVDFASKQIRVEKSKGNKDRIVYISPVLERELLWWLNRRPKAEGCSLFFHHQGIKYCYGAINEWVIRTRRKCQAHFTSHQLRHTFCTNLNQNGVPLEHRMTLMGHSKPETTMLYTKVFDKDVREAFFQAKRKEEENVQSNSEPIELGTIRDFHDMVVSENMSLEKI